MGIPGRVCALLTLLWIVQGDSQRVQIPRRVVEVVRGQAVVLEAWYSPTNDISKNTVLWNFDSPSNELKQVISYTPNGINDNTEWRRRVGFGVAMPSANISLLINDTQESDSGRYLCQVLVPSSRGLIGDLHLNVKVPPSPPVCSMEGSSVVRGNVTLSCHSGSGKPAPRYKWTKAAPASEVFFSPMQKWSSCPQPMLVLGFMDEVSGSLRLSNLTRGMSGKYVCRASNTAGSDSCSLTLDVTTASNSGVIAAASLGSILGFLAILLFLVVMVRRRRDYEDEVANEIKEDAQAPQRSSLAKSSGSDNISKNGTLSSIATSPRPRDPTSFHYPSSSPSPPYPPLPSHPSHVLAAYQLRPGGGGGGVSPLHGLPGYNGTPPTKQPRPPANGVPPHAPHGPSSRTPIGSSSHTQLSPSPLASLGPSPHPSTGHSPHPSTGHSPHPSTGHSPHPSTGHSPHPSTGHSPHPSLGHSPSWTKGAQPQAPPPSTLPPAGISQAPPPSTLPISQATLTRMGAVRVMVPPHSQAGSLV